MREPDDEFAKALSFALAKHSKLEKLSHELRQALVSKGFAPDTADAVLDRMQSRGIVDDERVVRLAFERSAGLKASSSSKVAIKLLARGAPAELVEAYATQGSGEGDLENMLLLLRKRYPDRENRAKAGRFLFSRGYSEETVESALEQYFGVEE